MRLTLDVIVDSLRTLGTDTSGVEAKRAAGGLPENLISTLCAFANRPGGGIVLLGIDEHAHFRSVSIDAAAQSRQLADLGRQLLDPPPSIDIDIEQFEENAIVVASVSELPAGSKPCRVRTGRHQGVWIRSFDGDYRASQTDEQALYSSRVAPTHDRTTIDGGSVADLDSDQIERFIRSRRAAAAPTSRIRSMGDVELLHAAGVLVDGTPTVGALLMLGVFPQRLLPGVHVRAVHRANDSTLRALDAPRIDGSIPEMIQATVDWVASRAGVAIRNLGGGRVVNEPAWPADAVRELIGNALLHRDLSWSVNEPVLVTLGSRELVIRNPGGLYGITVDELGRRGVTPARNANMMSIAAHVTMPNGDRTVEQLATGIPTIRRALDDYRYPAALFVDDAVRFTAICRSAVGGDPLNSGAQRALLDEIGESITTAANLAIRVARSEQVVRRDLRHLIAEGLVTTVGRHGRQLLYQRVSGS